MGEESGWSSRIPHRPAAGEVEREAARASFGALTCSTFTTIPSRTRRPDGSVMRVHYDIDRERLGTLGPLTIAQLENRRLDEPGEAVRADGQALTGVMAAAVAKRRDTHELIVVAPRFLVRHPQVCYAFPSRRRTGSDSRARAPGARRTPEPIPLLSWRPRPMDPGIVYPEVTDELLAEVVRRILAVGAPERVVLFGSHARGDARPDSDLDLPEVPGRAQRAADSAYARPGGHPRHLSKRRSDPPPRPGRARRPDALRGPASLRS